MFDMVEDEVSFRVRSRRHRFQKALLELAPYVRPAAMIHRKGRRGRTHRWSPLLLYPRLEPLTNRVAPPPRNYHRAR